MTDIDAKGGPQAGAGGARDELTNAIWRLRLAILIALVFLVTSGGALLLSLLHPLMHDAIEKATLAIAVSALVVALLAGIALVAARWRMPASASSASDRQPPASQSAEHG